MHLAENRYPCFVGGAGICAVQTQNVLRHFLPRHPHPDKWTFCDMFIRAKLNCIRNKVVFYFMYIVTYSSGPN